MRVSTKLSLCLFLAIQGASAATSGAYIGPILGVGHIRAHHENTASNGALFFSKGKNHNSFLGGLLLGWGVRTNCFYAGMEIEGMYDSADHTFYRTNVIADHESFRLKHQVQYGAALRFGFVMPSNIMAYARMGLSGGTWHLSYKATDNGETYRDGAHFHKVQVSVGAGLQAMISKSFSIRGEVRYSPHVFKKKTLSDFNSAPLKFGGTALRSRMAQVSALMAVTYHL